MKTVIKLLLLLAEFFAKWQRKQEERRHVEEVKEIENDPNAWMANHFGGVPDDNAPAPDKTDTQHGNRD